MHEAVSLQIPVCNNETKSLSISLSNWEQKNAEFLNQGSAKQQLNICVPFAGNWGYFLIHVPRPTVQMYKRKGLMTVLGMDVMTCILPNKRERERRFNGDWKTHGFSRFRVRSSREPVFRCVKDRRYSCSVMDRPLRLNATYVGNCIIQL